MTSYVTLFIVLSFIKKYTSWKKNEKNANIHMKSKKKNALGITHVTIYKLSPTIQKWKFPHLCVRFN